jgi:hypothetical protein
LPIGEARRGAAIPFLRRGRRGGAAGSRGRGGGGSFRYPRAAAGRPSSRPECGGRRAAVAIRLARVAADDSLGDNQARRHVLCEDRNRHHGLRLAAGHRLDDADVKAHIVEGHEPEGHELAAVTQQLVAPEVMRRVFTALDECSRRAALRQHSAKVVGRPARGVVARAA